MEPGMHRAEINLNKRTRVGQRLLHFSLHWYCTLAARTDMQRLAKAQHSLFWQRYIFCSDFVAE